MSRRNKILHNLPDLDDSDSAKTPQAFIPDDKLYYPIDPVLPHQSYGGMTYKPKDQPILINIDKITATAPPPPPPTIIKPDNMGKPVIDTKHAAAEVKTIEIKPFENKPFESKPAENKSAAIETKPTETKAEQVAVAVAKPDQELFNEEQLLFNLKIISELKKDDKLSYHDNQFVINDPGMKQGLYRWFYSQDRAKTLENINLLIDSTFAYIDNTFKKELTEGRYENYRNERVLYENNCQKLQKFREALLDTCRGLEKLKATYQEDRSMSSGIALIIDKIKTRTDKINKVMKISV